MVNGRRRGTDWIDTTVSTFLGSGSSFTAELLGARGIEDLAGCTSIRTLLRLNFTFSPTTPVDSVQVIDIGMGMASRESVTAVVLPDPDATSEFPGRGWIYKDQLVLVQDAVVMQPAVVVREDIRSKRKLDEAMMFITFVNTALAGTADSVQIRGLIRLLCLLP